MQQGRLYKEMKTQEIVHLHIFYERVDEEIVMEKYC